MKGGMPPGGAASLLSVEGFSVRLRLPYGELRACEDVSFTVEPGEALGVVGESGSGKSVTMLSIMGLMRGHKEGVLRFKGNPMEDLSSLRGRDVAMVFQNPLNSLNPSMRIGRQLTEVLTEHLGLTEREAERRVLSVMERLAVPEPESLMRRYPFEYSGGMRQRVMIAMAMLCEPSLLIADEPTTALDVTNQAQILHLFRELQERFGTSLIFISHDLSVVSQIAHRVMVMYAGSVMEVGPSESLFRDPLHPYTRGLVASLPRLLLAERKKPLASIPGAIPSLIDPPEGCRFLPRCPRAVEKCALRAPKALHVGNRIVCCWLYEEGGALS
ncbi:ABC transporter ATP-binding protein [Fretibacterium sp. OH1220_COT-178]|uniref:ABC transporter ATP-binding protein n=1 Tax=Fretibacterium sp. OH1220_COT-178 TaxID=2491047 RepID=UPI0018F46CB9|nr:ABC transporter ATP-binding protein [Fretibacterium sp. OH1220_COT-178]